MAFIVSLYICTMSYFMNVISLACGMQTFKETASTATETIRIMVRSIVVALIFGACFHASAKAQFLGCTRIDQLSLEDCRALEKLFYDTDGFRWLNARGWLQTNQPCDWYGITCRTSGWPREITHIDLSGNNLTGTLPGDLAFLSELQSLRIDNSGPGIRLKKLTSVIPATLGDLKHLEVLSFNSNAFTGAIPAELGNLINLRELDLGNNKLTGGIPERLGQLTNLKHLDLSVNQLGGAIPDTLQNLTRLEHLNISHNSITREIPDWIGQMNLLDFLDVSHNQLSGNIPPELHQLGQLLWLSLTNNQFTGALPLSLASFASNIIHCELGETQLCIPDSPPYAYLGEVCSLTPQNSCKICEGSHCSTLETIYTQTNGPSWGQSDGWLASSDPCQWHGVQCSNQDITHLALPNNNLSGNLPNTLSSLQNLQNLDLSSNDLQGEIPVNYGELTQLTRLDLSDNQLTGILPLEIATLGTKIDQCDLSMNAGICLPDTDEYTTINVNPICELPKRSDCSGYGFVQIMDLNAIIHRQSIELTWSTTQPSISITFFIERVQPPQTIAQVFGSPESSMTFSYTVRDLQPGMYSFQIRQVNSNGTEQVSEPITVELYPEALMTGLAYPNPFSAETKFEITTGLSGSVTIELYDLLGREVRTLFSGTPPMHQPIDITLSGRDLSNGVYFIRSSLDGRLISSQRVMRVE